MQIENTNLEGVFLIKPKVFGDNRGFFFESYHENRYQNFKMFPRFVQDNMSRSSRGTLRGLHYQLNQPQCKLLSVMRGSIFDVAVDIRQGSPTFGQWYGAILDDENHNQLFISEGFAHGFYVLSEVADVHYKCSDYYAPHDEHGILWDDKDLGIHWPLFNFAPILSQKDGLNKKLSEMEKSNLPKFIK